MLRRNTWIALGSFLGVLAIYLVWSASRDAAPQIELTPEPDPLWTVESSAIVELTVENLSTGEIMALKRDEESLWLIVAPEAGPADAARVEQAISWLAAPRPRAELPQTLDLAPFLLDAPLWRVEIVLRDGRRHEFTVGRDSPTGGSKYVLTPGRSGVLVLSSFGLDEVLQLPQDLLPTPTPEPTPTATAEPSATAEGEMDPEAEVGGSATSTPAIQATVMP